MGTIFYVRRELRIYSFKAVVRISYEEREDPDKKNGSWINIQPPKLNPKRNKKIGI